MDTPRSPKFGRSAAGSDYRSSSSSSSSSALQPSEQWMLLGRPRGVYTGQNRPPSPRRSDRRSRAAEPEQQKQREGEARKVFDKNTTSPSILERRMGAGAGGASGGHVKRLAVDTIMATNAVERSTLPGIARPEGQQQQQRKKKRHEESRLLPEMSAAVRRQCKSESRREVEEEEEEDDDEARYSRKGKKVKKEDDPPSGMLKTPTQKRLSIGMLADGVKGMYITQIPARILQRRSLVLGSQPAAMTPGCSTGRGSPAGGFVSPMPPSTPRPPFPAETTSSLSSSSAAIPTRISKRASIAWSADELSGETQAKPGR